MVVFVCEKQKILDKCKVNRQELKAKTKIIILSLNHDIIVN